MKFKLLEAIVVTCLLIAGCSSTEEFIKPRQEEIDVYIQLHPDLPEVDKSCIYDGRFEIGIKQETLFFLLGEPAAKESVTEPWAIQEKWRYKGRNHKIFIIEDHHVVGILEED